LCHEGLQHCQQISHSASLACRSMSFSLAFARNFLIMLGMYGSGIEFSWHVNVHIPVHECIQRKYVAH